MKSNSYSLAFTFIELLIVIFLISVFIGISSVNLVQDNLARSNQAAKYFAYKIQAIHEESLYRNSNYKIILNILKEQLIVQKEIFIEEDDKIVESEFKTIETVKYNEFISTNKVSILLSTNNSEWILDQWGIDSNLHINFIPVGNMDHKQIKSYSVIFEVQQQKPEIIKNYQ